MPEGYRYASRGVIVNLEVRSADDAYREIVRDGGVKPILDIRDEDFGQRHFIVVDPGGNLVDVIQNIAPDESYVESYSDGR